MPYGLKYAFYYYLALPVFFALTMEKLTIQTSIPLQLFDKILMVSHNYFIHFMSIPKH